MRKQATRCVGVGRREKMNKCVGIENKPCGVEFDPGLEFPDDTVCDECWDQMINKVRIK